MHRRRLGRTGLVVGELGVGTRGIAQWRGVDPGDARRALEHAVGRGVDVIDTVADADIERLAGDVVRELRARDRAVVITKVAAGPRDAPLVHALPAAGVIEAVEASLRMTRLEVLPVCVIDPWVDRWLDDTTWPELRGTLDRLIREGKVLHWGVGAAVDAPGDAVRVLAEPVIEVVELAYSLLDRRAEAALMPAAREHDAGIVVRAPLAAGALGGELGAAARFHPDDARAGWFTPERLAQLAGVVAALAEHVADPPPASGSTEPARAALAAALARRGAAAGEVEARTVAELALRFALGLPAIAVVGMRTRDHVDANLAVADGRALSPALRDRLAPPPADADPDADPDAKR